METSIKHYLKSILKLFGVLEEIQTLNSVRVKRKSASVHGHNLLIRVLEKESSITEGCTLVEIGTTRENLPGQNSTQILANFSRKNKMKFITVDMDPLNSENAARFFEEISSDAIAVNAKGEDFVLNFNEKIFALYLDAFDIQEGQHSVFRISRYSEFLEQEITNEGSAKMHLDLCIALFENGNNPTYIAIDDTWLENGIWQGKGATTLPYLLEQNYLIVDKSSNAMCLKKK